MSKDIHIFDKIKDMNQINGNVIDRLLKNKSQRRTKSFYIIANDNMLEGL